MQERRGSAGAACALAAAAALLVSAIAAPILGAEAKPQDAEAKEPPEADAPLPPGDEKRPAPAYAQPEEPGAGSAALWVPRVLLFPLYVTTEYGLSRPAGALF